jgi:hypothetical protein
MAKSGKLDNPRDFFDEITRPNHADFFGSPSSFRTAFALAMSLFNLCEWVFEFNKADVEREFGKTFAKSGDLWQEVEIHVPEAKFIRDFANASKHVKLTIRPSTSMTHIANTEILSSSNGAGGWGLGRYSAPSVVFHDGGNKVYFDGCANKLFNFWENLIDKLYPPTPNAQV